MSVIPHRWVGNLASGHGRLCGRWWQWNIALIVPLHSSGPILDDASAAELHRPFRIGALTGVWGLTPNAMCQWRGLRKLSYRENEQFAIGVRFWGSVPTPLSRRSCGPDGTLYPASARP